MIKLFKNISTLIKNHYNLVNWVNGDLVFVSDKFDI